MRTEKQIQASRLNGAKSRGPVTVAGKRVSSRNARRRHALAHTLTLQAEDSGQFREILADLWAEYQPVGCTERNLVESLALLQWKQLRFRCAEKVAIDLQIHSERANPPEYEHTAAALISSALCNLTEHGRALNAMNLHDARLDRQYHRALNMLLKLQDRRDSHPDSDAPSDAKPESAAPDIVELDGAPEQSVEASEPVASTGLLGLPAVGVARTVLPSAFACLNTKNSGNEPGNALKTNESPQVRFPEPEPLPSLDELHPEVAAPFNASNGSSQPHFAFTPHLPNESKELASEPPAGVLLVDRALASGQTFESTGAGPEVCQAAGTRPGRVRASAAEIRAG
jgi:hypothetical protein